MLCSSALFLFSRLSLSFSENQDDSVRSTATDKRDAKDLAVLSSHQFLLWPLYRWNHCDITEQQHPLPGRFCPSSSSWAWTINLPKSHRNGAAKTSMAPAPNTPSSGMVAFSSWSTHIFYCHTSIYVVLNLLQLDHPLSHCHCRRNE